MLRLKDIWWRIMGRTEITTSQNYWDSDTPEILSKYRAELNTLVGKEGRAWRYNYNFWLTGGRIRIQFRRGKEEYATYFALKWC